MKINQDTFSKYINVTAFFADYCPGVANWKHKLRGKNGRGNPVEFTPEDQAAIRAGIKELKTCLIG